MFTLLPGCNDLALPSEEMLDNQLLFCKRHQIAPFLGIEFRGCAGRVHQIAEHHRDITALAGSFRDWGCGIAATEGVDAGLDLSVAVSDTSFRSAIAQAA
jgi:hypothetical protein